MEHSLMKGYIVNTGTNKVHVKVTAIRMSNDMDGNPRYKVQVWIDSLFGHIWCPKIEGYRRSKDDTYILKSVYNLHEQLDQFMNWFEVQVNEL